VQLESIEPAHCALAYFRITLEYLVTLDALIVADGDAGAVNETDARALSETEQLKEQGHLDCNARLQFHETVVRNCLGKTILQIALHIAQVVVLEVAIGVEVEADEDGHNLTVRHLSFAPTMLLTIATERIFFDVYVIFFAKIVCNTENFINFVGT
jgi:hypothetical protein